MTNAKLAASFMTGALAISLGLMGCASNSTNSGVSSGAESAPIPAEAASSNSPAAVETISSSIDDAYTGTHYWKGTLDSGATFFWLNDETTKTAQIIVFHAQGGSVPSLAFSGPVNISTDKTDVTITNAATSQTLSFKITDCPDPNSISIDAGEHGTGVLAAISSEQFQSDTESVIAQMTARTEESATNEEAKSQEGEGTVGEALPEEGEGAVGEALPEEALPEEALPQEGEYVEIESEEVV